MLEPTYPENAVSRYTQVEEAFCISPILWWWRQFYYILELTLFIYNYTDIYNL